MLNRTTFSEALFISALSTVALIPMGIANPAFAQDDVNKGGGFSKITMPTRDQASPGSDNENDDGTSPGDSSSHGARKNTGNGISYHGGPLILGTTNVYYIWYGSWAGNTAQNILTNFAATIGGSSYFNINTTYTNGSGTRVTNAVNYAAGITDNYSHGSSLKDADVQAIVAAAINGTDPVHQSGTLPYDANGVYFVLTSADVDESSGFCSQYCGWHWYQSLNGGNIKYAFIGNPDRCPAACEEQTISPNNNSGADGMASIIAHELEESVTDPLGNAWYDTQGNENADKCAWTFGTEGTAGNGSKYNVVLNGVEYLIQRNWVNASGGYCSMSF